MLRRLSEKLAEKRSGFDSAATRSALVATLALSTAACFPTVPRPDVAEPKNLIQELCARGRCTDKGSSTEAEAKRRSQELEDVRLQIIYGGKKYREYDSRFTGSDQIGLIRSWISAKVANSYPECVPARDIVEFAGRGNVSPDRIECFDEGEKPSEGDKYKLDGLSVKKGCTDHECTDRHVAASAEGTHGFLAANELERLQSIYSGKEFSGYDSRFKVVDQVELIKAGVSAKAANAYPECVPAHDIVELAGPRNVLPGRIACFSNDEAEEESRWGEYKIDGLNSYFWIK